MNVHERDQPIVVGVRDEQPGLLSFALGLAKALGSRMRVVHSYRVPFPHAYTALYAGKDPADALSDTSREVISDARSHLEDMSTGTDVEYELVYGYPPAVLGVESRRAKALVIGTDDLSWIDRITDAAVTSYLCMHAASPVVVVPPRVSAFDLTDVTVTIDGETSAHGPLQFAFELADKASVDLHVLHATDQLSSFSDLESARMVVAEVLAGWMQAYPDVTVISELTTGDPADRALSATGDASLIVAGRPHPDRRGGWRPPVARTLVKAGARPIAVVPADYAI